MTIADHSFLSDEEQIAEWLTGPEADCLAMEREIVLLRAWKASVIASATHFAAEDRRRAEHPDLRTADEWRRRGARDLADLVLDASEKP